MRGFTAAGGLKRQFRHIRGKIFIIAMLGNLFIVSVFKYFAIFDIKLININEKPINVIRYNTVIKSL